MCCLFVCLFRPVSCKRNVASVSVLSYLDCPLNFSPCFVLYYPILTALSFLCRVICVACLFFVFWFVLCLVASVSVLSYLDCPLVVLHVSSCVLLPVSLYYPILTALSFLCRVICVVCLFVSSCVLLPMSLYYPILTAP
jgi:hypothetical protein